MQVEVVYALPDAQQVASLRVAEGATVADAVAASGLLARFPELAEREPVVGIYGRRVALTQPLADGDRVEIYRALIADPKQLRRRRARKLNGRPG